LLSRFRLPDVGLEHKFLLLGEASENIAAHGCKILTQKTNFIVLVSLNL
jgi:hypothetical protein